MVQGSWNRYLPKVQAGCYLGGTHEVGIFLLLYVQEDTAFNTAAHSAPGAKCEIHNALIICRYLYSTKHNCPRSKHLVPSRSLSMQAPVQHQTSTLAHILRKVAVRRTLSPY